MQTFTGTESETPPDYEQLILPQVYARCPHLGTAEEPETALGYASTANHCYRLDDLLPVALGHQQDFCLTNSHANCSIFCNGETAVLTEVFQTTDSEGLIEPSAQRGRSRTAVFVLLMGFIILSVGFWQFGAIKGNSWKLTLPEPSFSAVAQMIDPTLTPRASQIPASSAESGGIVVGSADSVATVGTEAVATALSSTAEPTFMATAVSTSSNETTSSTETPSPTGSPISFDIVTIIATLVPTATATAASCGHPSSWYTYTVRPGDTASGIAQSQGLTLEELMLANCMTVSSLFWGQVLWLPNRVIVPTAIPPNFPTPGETAVPPQGIPATPTTSLGNGATPVPSTPVPSTPSPAELSPTPLPPSE